MKVIYKTDDGKEFEDRTQAEKYEKLTKEKLVISRKEEVKLIPLSELKNIFDIGSVIDLSFYIKNEDGAIEEDGFYETNMIDDSGHLNCSDYAHGLLEWSEEGKTYYRIVHGRYWKVELLGISKVSYY